MGDPASGEHHVEPSELLDHPVDERLHLPRLAHVDATAIALPAALGDLPGHR